MAERALRLRGVTILPHRGPSYRPTRAGLAPANLDFLAAPAAWAARWHARLRHRAWVSDHGCLMATPRSASSAAPRARCTPAMLAALPEAARADLRGRFHTLTLLFCIPTHLGAAPDLPPAPPPPPRSGSSVPLRRFIPLIFPFAADEEALPFLPALAR